MPIVGGPGRGRPRPAGACVSPAASDELWSRFLCAAAPAKHRDDTITQARGATAGSATVADVKRRFSEGLGRARRQGQRSVVMRRSQPVAALVPLGDLRTQRRPRRRRRYRGNPAQGSWWRFGRGRTTTTWIRLSSRSTGLGKPRWAGPWCYRRSVPPSSIPTSSATSPSGVRRRVSSGVSPRSLWSSSAWPLSPSESSCPVHIEAIDQSISCGNSRRAYGRASRCVRPIRDGAGPRSHTRRSGTVGAPEGRTRSAVRSRRSGTRSHAGHRGCRAFSECSWPPGRELALIRAPRGPRRRVWSPRHFGTLLGFGPRIRRHRSNG